jgi:hypothetical protein
MMAVIYNKLIQWLHVFGGIAGQLFVPKNVF